MNLLGLKRKARAGAADVSGAKEGGKSTLAALAQNSATATIAVVVVALLLQFGLIGPGAKATALESERRLTRVETQVESLEKAIDKTRTDLLGELRGLRADLKGSLP